LHESHIAFGNEFALGQAVAAITHGDLGDEPQMRSDKFLRGRRIFVLAPAFGEHVLFPRGQDREPTNCRKIVIEAAFGGDDAQGFRHIFFS